jgi:hypothetical protein
MRGSLVTHEQAESKLSAERYVLDELTAEERAQFEEHFFVCNECAQDVRDLSVVSDHVRSSLADQERPAANSERARNRLQNWLYAASLPWLRPGFALTAGCALVALTVVTGWQVLSNRAEMQPYALASVMLRPEARSEVVSIDAGQQAPFLLLEADVPGASGELKWELYRNGGTASVGAGSAQAPDPGASFKLLAPRSKMEPGEYRLTISSGQSAAAEKKWVYRFKID